MTETAEKTSEYGVIYTHTYNGGRFKGGSSSIQVFGHGEDMTECKKELRASIDLWTKRLEEYKEKNDADGIKFAGDYAAQYKKDLETVRVIKKIEYQKELDAVILQEAEEISEDDYDEMLGCLPPLKMGQNYFIMSEFFTGTYTSQFYKKDGKFYHKMIDYKRPETWAQL
jgi:hypothetical protein